MHVLPPWVHPDIDPSNTICCRFDMGPTLCFGAMSPAGLCAVPHLHPTPRRASQAPQMNPFVPFSCFCVFSLYLSLERKLSAALPVPLGWAISHPVQRGMQDAPIPTHRSLLHLPGCPGREARQGLVGGEILSCSPAGARCKPEVLLSLCSSCESVFPLLPWFSTSANPMRCLAGTLGPNNFASVFFLSNIILI